MCSKNTQTKAMNQSSVQRNPYCYSWHEANICGLQVKNKNKPIKVKSETSQLLQIHMHHEMCNLALIQNQYAPPNVQYSPYSKSICTTKCVIIALIQSQYAPPNVKSRPCYNSICTTCQDSNQGPSGWKLSVQTTTPSVRHTILIEKQAIILPR